MEAETAPAFSAWLDAFFAVYFRRQPVNATFIGMHDFDDRLPDLSADGQAAAVDEARSLIKRLEALPPETLSPAQALDRQLARGFLELELWELESQHFGPANPSLYTGEAIFGVLSLLLRPFVPLQERLERAAARLERVPAFLDTPRASERPGPRAWIERARRECTGARVLLDRGVPQLLSDAGLTNAALERAAARASEAFARFDAYLERELLPPADENYACGAEAFDLILRRSHFFDGRAEELEARALEVLAATPRTTGHEASSAVDNAPRRCGELWQAVRDLVEQHQLVTWPDDWPVRFVEQPEWVREAAPYLYFLPYRSPAPLDATPVTECFVPARADETTIKLNYVVHHASLGHHLQNRYAARAESRIGQIAAVDCASRIAMLCGGSIAEGWACYAVDLARDAGFLSPTECAEHDHTRRRIAARAVVDVRLHHGRMSFAEAAEFYQQQAGMSAAAAVAEATKNSLFPGAACMYLIGWDGLWRLRREVQAREGTAFSVRAFHDRVLSFGSLPVALVAQAMSASGEVAVQAHR